MKVTIHREDPDPPPVSFVTIEISKDEAILLRQLTGTLSRNMLRNFFSLELTNNDELVETMYLLTSGLYRELSEKGPIN